MWESEDRTCVNYNWSFRNNWEGIVS
jgi:hypothetical protein